MNTFDPGHLEAPHHFASMHRRLHNHTSVMAIAVTMFRVHHARSHQNWSIPPGSSWPKSGSSSLSLHAGPDSIELDMISLNRSMFVNRNTAQQNSAAHPLDLNEASSSTQLQIAPSTLPCLLFVETHSWALCADDSGGPVPACNSSCEGNKQLSQHSRRSDLWDQQRDLK